MLKINIDKEFIPRQFNSNPIEEILQKDERKVLVKLRTKESEESYKSFDSDFYAYLNKLPEGPAKEYVTKIYNDRLFFIGVSKTGEIASSSRLLITKENRLAGIVLNSYNLNIDPDTGETSDIDECIYATYYGLIRAAVLTNEKEIKKDKDLHKLITTYLFLLFLKLLGKSMMVASKQKHQLHALCAYIFYRHFFGEKHAFAMNILNKEYRGEIIPDEVFDDIVEWKETTAGKKPITFYEKMENDLVPFNSTKDLPRIIAEFKIADVSPPQFMMLILKTLQQSGFYSIIGPLDNLISSIIISSYPTNIVNRGMFTNESIHKNIEKIICKLIERVKYDTSAIPNDMNTLNKRIEEHKAKHK